MSAKCDCPNCAKHSLPPPARWPNGDLVLEFKDLDELRILGLSVSQIIRAIHWARSHGWTENEV